MSDCFDLYGLVVRSEIPLPAPSVVDREVDVEIQFGTVPASLPGALVTGRYMDADAESVLLRVGSVGRFWIRHGRLIVIDPGAGQSVTWLLQVLLSTVFAAVLQQRRVLTLHGSAVAVGERAVVIVGHSGSGKSTLAGALVHRGQTLLSDGFAAVTGTSDVPMVLPGPAAQKLWPDSARYLGFDEHAHPTLAMGSEKRLVIDPSPHVGRVLPLWKVCVLAGATDAEFVGRAYGQQSVHVLAPHLFLPALSRLGPTDQAGYLLDLAQRCPIHVMTRPARTPPLGLADSLAVMAASILDGAEG